MNITLNVLHNATQNSYDIYIQAQWVNDSHTMVVHGAQKERMEFFEGIASLLGYVKVLEGDTFEMHTPLLDEYAKSVYSAADGNVTVVSEHGNTTTIVALS